MENNIPERGITITHKMENKTKEQLDDEGYKVIDVTNRSSLSRVSFIAGWDARQPEIDALTPKWISADDELPKSKSIYLDEASKDVNFKDKNGYIYYGFYNKKHKIWIVPNYKGDTFYIENVTEWLYLPNPPKQAKP